MPREDLLQALASLDPPTPPACFVLLWSHIEKVGLDALESHLRGQGIAVGRLPNEMDWRREAPEEVIDRLHRLDGFAFERAALEWLIKLDKALGNRRSARWRHIEMRGVDNARWLLCHRNNPLARHFLEEHQRLTGPSTQGGSLSAYVRKTIAVPLEPVQRRHFDIHTEESWASRSVHRRLKQDLDHRRLRVLCWPFRPHITHPELPDLRRQPEFARLQSISNEDEVLEDAAAAVDAASEQRATILLLPELTASAAVEEEIRRRLAAAQRPPVLTVVGLCHRPAPGSGGKLDVNEAIVIDQSGRELYRHRKLYALQLWREQCSEQLQTGHTIPILESPIGNLVVLICLDFFHDKIQPMAKRCHGNFYLVPSLSPKTTAHQSAAQALTRFGEASSFVVNRRLDRALEAHPVSDRRQALGEGSSFFQLPHRRGLVTHFVDQPARPFLLFDLAAELPRG